MGSLTNPLGGDLEGLLLQTFTDSQEKTNWTTSHPHAGEVNFNLLQSKLFDSLIGVLG